MRPESFAIEHSEDWSRWVLANGLPELPTALGFEESVPVSRWIGPSTAAVLHLRRVFDDGEVWTETDVELFCLVDGGWKSYGGGGGGWDAMAPLTRSAVPPRYADLSGVNSGASGGRGCKAVWGEVGAGAMVVEVEQVGVTTRRPVEAPLGLLTVCAEYEHPFTVRVLDSAGGELAVIHEPAGLDSW